MPATKTFTWTGGASGLWTTAGNWNPAAAPGPSALAVIGADIVTVPNASPLPSPASPDGVAVGALNLATGGELIVAPGTNVGSGYYNLPSDYAPSTSTFSIEGVAASDNAGTIFLSDGASLRLTGNIANTGTISLNASPTSTNVADKSNLVIVGNSSQGVSGGVNLTGGGTIQLSDSVENQINGTVLQSRSADILTSNNTIEGVGYVEHLTFNNSGTVDATSSDHFLTFNDDTIANSGLFESTGAIGLFFNGGTVIDNVGAGRITTGSGDYVGFADATVENGTLSGGFYLDGAATFDGASLLTIAAGSTVYADEQTLTLEGAIQNNGVFSLGSSPAGTGELAIDGLVLLGGTGDIAMNGAIVDNGSAATLFNLGQTISGEGEIGSGDGKLTLINGGTVDATGALTLDTGNFVFNFGELEATAGGALTISDAVINTGDSISADRGAVMAKGAVYGGGLDISGAKLQLAGAAYGVAANFETGGGELQLEDAPAFNGTIAGFGQTGNNIDLADIAYVAGKTKWSFTENAAKTSGVLTINDSALGGPAISLTLLGALSAADFSVGPNSSGVITALATTGAGSSSAGTLISYQSQTPLPILA